jgi:ParB family transcriptional regulator, chromosome partitioning protein
VSKERRLGRGLEALLGRSWDQAEPAETIAAAPAEELLTRDDAGQLWIDCDAIERNPYQPRQTFDEAEIADLADSIRAHGILQPLVVRRDGERIELIAGRCQSSFARLMIARWLNWPLLKTFSAKT